MYRLLYFKLLPAYHIFLILSRKKFFFSVYIVWFGRVSCARVARDRDRTCPHDRDRSLCKSAMGGKPNCVLYLPRVKNICSKKLKGADPIYRLPSSVQKQHQTFELIPSIPFNVHI